jgi:glycosyltransferase involved in cell wall biosynthesis
MRYIVLAGEEAGPVSNKLGGIWEVINAEAKTLLALIERGEIEECKIILMGPYYKTRGADWHTGKNRITNLRGLEPLEMDESMEKALDLFGDICEVKLASAKVGRRSIGYCLFDTSSYALRSGEYGELSMLDEVKREAYELVGLDSLSFERTWYGREYSHYLALSHAISTFVRSLSFFTRVSLHCHEFGVFYAAARLKRMGAHVTSVATLHATIPGRYSGAGVLEKLSSNDSTWPPSTPVGLASLEALAGYADHVTFVGDSTRREAKLFYGFDGLVVRNGIEVKSDKIDWDKREKNMRKIQRFLSENIYKYYGGRKMDPEKILPVFTISRIELENKGYPDLLKSLMIYDRIMQHHIANGKIDEDVRIVCFLITSHGPKERERLPKGFPVYLPEELLVGEEMRLKQMIYEHDLHVKNLITGRRVVAAVLYPTWVGKNDGGLNMTVEEIASGCVAAIFPSRYDPFLLTGLEAAKEGTPVIVSRVCGFSDAVREWRVKKGLMGGVMLVDNIKPSYIETLTDYAMGLETITKNYLRDRSKYMMMCGEALRLAMDMGWEEPVRRYYQILTS